MGADDASKLRTILSAANCSESLDPARFTLRRLGKPNPAATYPRPLHVVLETPAQRDAIIEKARNLKNAGNQYSRVFIRKDVHPVVRKEIGRLKKLEREEKNKAENSNANIRYDHVRRVLLKDDVIIDRFTPKFF